MTTNAQERLVTELRAFFAPLVTAGQSTAGRRALFGEYGWDLDAITGLPVEDIAAAVRGVDEALRALEAFSASPPQDLADLANVLKAANSVRETVQAFARLLDGTTVPKPPDFAHLGADLIELLSIRYLRDRHPVAYAVAQLLTLVSERAPDELPAGHRDPTTQALVRFPAAPPRLQLERIGILLSDPGGTLAGAYLGTAGVSTLADARAAASRLFPPLGALLDELGVGGYRLDDDRANAATWGNAGADLAASSLLIHYPIGSDGSEIGAILTLSAASGGGLEVVLSPVGALEFSQTLGSWETSLKVTGSLQAIALSRQGVAVVGAGGAVAPNERVKAHLELRKIAAPSNAAFLVGSATGTRLEIGQAVLRAGLDAGAGRRDFGVEADAHAGAIVIAPGQGDGFVSRILPAKEIRADFDLTLGWSRERGLVLSGGAGIEVTLAVHVDVGGGLFTLDAVYLAASVVGGGAIRAVVAVSAQVHLGPVRANVRRIGLRGELAFPAGGGNLGPADLDVSFKAPDGAGLSLDTPAVTGGGYVEFDEAKGLYSGLLRLEIKGGIGVTAIGLISTKLPGGKPGFSLLVIIAAEFPAIQLGFGFTLSGIGGLLGVNREMRVDVLRAGVRNRVLDSILFPPDPVKNASRVIADLQRVFPVSEGRFVIGLMARIGWGSPRILSVDLGVILELPAPIRIAILGRLSLQLPQDKAVVQLKMDVLGILDFDRREASIDATLYDSRVAKFTVSGDMAVRLSFGASPAFAMSAGGFNPRFTPPPEFPELARMAIALATGNTPRLTLEAYFAKTPATVQFGARLDVYASLDAGIFGFYEASGYLSFDALVQPFPPMFIIDIAGQLVLRRNKEILFGIDVWLSLSGPTPWRACGEATVHFLGKHTIPFDVTIGREAVLPALPAVDPLGDLLGALGLARNWTGMLPTGGSGPVTVQPLDPGAVAVVHPFGSLTVRQEALPLGLTVSRYQNVELTTPVRFEITDLAFGPSSAPVLVPAAGPTRTHFATGEYVTRSGEENLSQPAYESFRCGHTGIGFAPGPLPVRHGPAVARPDEDYDTAIIDQAEPQPKPEDVYRARPEVLDLLTSTAAAGRSPMLITGTEGYTGPPSGLKLREPRYRVARRADMKAASDSIYDTAAEAQDALRDDHDRALQMVGAHELAR